jgi:hypothetical protein
MSRRRKIFATIAVLLAVLAGFLVWFRVTLPDRLRGIIMTAISERYGVEATADAMTLNLVAGTASLHGVVVKDGTNVLLEVARVDGVADAREIADGHYDFRQLVLVRPLLRLVAEPGGGTNLERILATPGPPSSGPETFVVVRELRIVDGRAEYADAVVDPERPLKLTARDVSASVTEVQLGGEPATHCATDLRVDGLMDHPAVPARVSIVAWRTARGVRPERLAFHAAATGCDLSLVPQYVSRTERTAIGGNLIHLVADIQATDGVIDPGAIAGEVDGTRTVLPMKVGGRTTAPVFDLSSTLGSMLRIPLDRMGSVGDVVKETGRSALRGAGGAAREVGGGVVGAGSAVGGGFVTAAENVAAGDPLGALASVGGGAVGGVKKLGSGIVAGLKNLIGIGADAVSQFSAEDAAAYDARFKELHRERRLAMLEAALASVPPGDDGGRRRRIEEEIAALSEK